MQQAYVSAEGAELRAEGQISRASGKFLKLDSLKRHLLHSLEVSDWLSYINEQNKAQLYL